MTVRVRGVPLCLVVAVLAACGGGSGDVEPEGTAAASLEITSDAFGEGETIPMSSTCDGQDEPPPLSWSGAPAGTRHVAVTLTDPDAPAGTFVHWLAIFPPDGEAPSVEGRNDFGDTGYGGPCPPETDDPHRYVFTVYAAGRELDLQSGFSAADLEDALDGQVLAEGQLTAVYGR